MSHRTKKTNFAVNSIILTSIVSLTCLGCDRSKSANENEANDRVFSVRVSDDTQGNMSDFPFNFLPDSTSIGLIIKGSAAQDGGPIQEFAPWFYNSQNENGDLVILEELLQKTSLKISQCERVIVGIEKDRIVHSYLIPVFGPSTTEMNKGFKGKNWRGDPESAEIVAALKELKVGKPIIIVQLIEGLDTDSLFSNLSEHAKTIELDGHLTYLLENDRVITPVSDRCFLFSKIQIVENALRSDGTGVIAKSLASSENADFVVAVKPKDLMVMFREEYELHLASRNYYWIQETMLLTEHAVVAVNFDKQQMFDGEFTVAQEVDVKILKERLSNFVDTETATHANIRPYIRPDIHKIVADLYDGVNLRTDGRRVIVEAKRPDNILKLPHLIREKKEQNVSEVP